MTAIHDVLVTPLRRIPDERGAVLHMLREDSPGFERFGEIYFSSVYPGVVKGWHKHRDMTLNYACIQGLAKIVVYDERDGSPTKGNLQELFVGRDNYCLVQIPPDTWNGFTAVGTQEALIANCCTHVHDPERSVRLDPFQNHIPYSWAVKSH